MPEQPREASGAGRRPGDRNWTGTGTGAGTGRNRTEENHHRGDPSQHQLACTGTFRVSPVKMRHSCSAAWLSDASRPRTPAEPNGFSPWLHVRPSYGLHEPRPSTTVPKPSLQRPSSAAPQVRPSSSPQELRSQIRPLSRGSGPQAAWAGEFDRPATAMSGVSGTSSIFSSPCSSPVDNGGHSLLDNSNNGLLSTKELHGFVTATSTRRDSRPTTRPASLYWGSPSPSVDKTVQRSSRGQHSQRPGTRRALQVERMSKLSSTQTRTSFAVGLPYYAPTPKQSAAMADRRDIYSRKRDQARMQGIERGEPWRRRKQTQDALASQIAYESHHSAVAAERGDIRFLPSLPQAVDLARGTWAWDEAHETPAAREAAVASVRVLRDDPAATLKILAAWKAPSMSKQLAARFKELKLVRMRCSEDAHTQLPAQPPSPRTAMLTVSLAPRPRCGAGQRWARPEQVADEEPRSTAEGADGGRGEVAGSRAAGARRGGDQGPGQG